MNSSSLTWRIAVLLALCMSLVAAAALAQTPEEEEPAQTRPNPVEQRGLTPPEVLAINQISGQIRTMGGRSYLPVADLARALGSPSPPTPGDPGDPIHLQAGRGGVLQLNASAMASRSRYARPQGSAAAGQKVQKVSPAPAQGVKSQGKKWRGQPSTAPARGAVAQAQPGSLFVGSSLVSRGIIIVNGMPMVPVDDVAAALGAKIVPHGGGLAFEKIPGRVGILSF